MPFKKNIGQATVNRRVSFFDHEGHQILLLDLTYCTPQEAIQSLQEFKETLSNQSAYSILTTRTIIDLTDGRFTPETSRR